MISTKKGTWKLCFNILHFNCHYCKNTFGQQL